ncbi:MAG: quinolinate synthase NadA [Paludibacteraceae bacterium]|nr:quinolinate synthase NadA [Paludibacteraceae bacterium]
MNTRELQDEINRLKKEKNICILVHAYQNHDIWEVADYVGDSFGLSQKAAQADADTIIMCGVRFMAETVKMLAPEKKVILSNAIAGCPMAEQISVEEIQELKKQYPGHTVVAYVNTTAALKTQCDVCVTSSSAVKVVKAIPNDKILFIPDCNLGSWVEKQVPEKKFVFVKGGCPVHLSMSTNHVKLVKEQHPNALLLVHPECHAEVTAMADFVGSTTEIMSFAKKSDAKEFIIGTENSIVQHLQFECMGSGKRFFPLSKTCICQNMKLTTLGDVYECVQGIGGEEITMTEEMRLAAKRSIDEMLKLG